MSQVLMFLTAAGTGLELILPLPGGKCSGSPAGLAIAIGMTRPDPSGASD